MSTSTIVPVTKEQHALKHWRRYTNYKFSSADTVAGLVAAELPKACMSMPIGFFRQDDRFILVALLGLGNERNLFVDAQGRWIGGYIPAAYRAHPFRLANSNDQQVLCIDEASDLVTDPTQDSSEAFFDEKGEPSEAIKKILEFLVQVEANRKTGQRAIDFMQSKNLIVPWPIELKASADAPKNTRLEGLYRIDEAQFNKLSASEFEELRQAGGLAIAYCQMLSMQHLGLLSRLHALPQKASKKAATALPATPTGEIDFSFLADDKTMGFGSNS